MQDTLEYIAYRFIGSFVRLLPWQSVSVAGKILGSFIFFLLPVRKALTLSNLRHAFPEKSEREINIIARRAYQNFFISMLEVFWFSRFTPKKVRGIIVADDLSKMDEALSKGRGLIMLGGHFGNWELVALSVGVLSGHPLTIIVKEQRNKFVDRFMNSARTMFGNKVVVMDKAPREILRELRDNGVVAMLADQSGPQEGIFVRYFDRPAAAHKGPAVFSVRSGAPIIMAFLIRQGHGRYRIDLADVDTETLTGTEEEKIRELTRRHTVLLEQYVTRYPDHWLWMHKRWKHSDKAPAELAEAANPLGKKV
ncbi:MAG: lysophospholipid acyltransferase family protein [Bacteroidota bacterium]|nr:lysophospholipid acyltransferase family protein [Bacteroidota bacterium]